MAVTAEPTLPGTLVSLAEGGTGVLGIAALTGRLSYALMCLTLCWGVLTATGWVRRLTGRRALRGGHVVLATLTLAFGAVHAASFAFLPSGGVELPMLVVPLLPNSLVRHTLGVVGLQLMVAVAVTACLHRWTAYRRWIWLHRGAYVAVALLALHSLFGAIAGGTLAVLWLGGITFLVPAVVLTVLRLLPVRALERIGLIQEQV